MNDNKGNVIFWIVLFMIISLSVMFSIVIADNINNINNNKEVINEYCEEKEVVQKQLRQIDDNDNYEYRIYFDNDDFVTIGEKLYDKIEMGDKVIVEYERNWDGSRSAIAGVGLCDE